MKCPKCDGQEVEVLSTGEILCKNPRCMKVSRKDHEKEVKENVSK